MIEIPSAAVKHFQFIILGIWPVNLLMLWARGHEWAWEKTPQEIIGLWEWGLFVSFSLAILLELGVKMFFALAERRQRIEEAKEAGRAEGREEGRAEGRKEGREEGRQEGLAEARQTLLAEARQTAAQDIRALVDVLDVTARTNPDLLPELLQEYRARYQNGASNGYS